jgi:hypothetical protein
MKSEKKTTDVGCNCGAHNDEEDQRGRRAECVLRERKNEEKTNSEGPSSVHSREEPTESARKGKQEREKSLYVCI